MSVTADIAAKLTKAQRKAVSSARWYEARNAYNPAGFYVSADKRVRYRLARGGLIRDYLSPHQRLTKLGLEIREHLLAKKGGAA